MGSYLDQILESTRLRLTDAARKRSFNDLEREIRDMGASRSFAAAIREPGMSLIAEIKRRSPSAGAIRDEVDPAGLAEKYELGGARAVSVLTEPEFFAGRLEDLGLVHNSVRLPVLRKDFVIDPYQVVEARAAGADAVLLIVAAHPDPGLFKEIAAAAASYDLDCLIEVHDFFELDWAFEVEPSVVGVNQRDLATFEVDQGLAVRVRSEIPDQVAVVAESGVGSRQDVEELEKGGIDAVLVGETLMRSDKPDEAVRTLLGLEENNAG